MNKMYFNGGFFKNNNSVNGIKHLHLCKLYLYLRSRCKFKVLPFGVTSTLTEMFSSFKIR